MSSRNSSSSRSHSRSCFRSRSSKHYRSTEGKRRRNNYDEDSFTDLSHDDRSSHSSSRSYSYSNSHSSSRSRSRSRGSNKKNAREHSRDHKQLQKQQHSDTPSQLGPSDVFYLRHKDKICKLSLTEKLDETYLSKIFNIEPNDIIGFEMDGLLIQLSNDNLASLIGGRVIKLNVMNECEAKTQNIQIIEFHSHNDWGESAVKQMNEWLQKPTKPEREIVHIRRKYVISEKRGSLFWWTVSYCYLPK